MSDVEIRVTPDAQENATANPAGDQGKYVGMWVTADGHIRHELLPGGRYDEARGRQKTLIKGATGWKATTSSMWTILALPQTESFEMTCCTTRAWCYIPSADA